MDTQGIVATVGTILLFALIAFLVGWLKKKGSIEFKTPPYVPRSPQDFNNDLWRRASAPGRTPGNGPMGIRLPR